MQNIYTLFDLYFNQLTRRFSGRHNRFATNTVYTLVPFNNNRVTYILKRFNQIYIFIVISKLYDIDVLSLSGEQRLFSKLTAGNSVYACFDIAITVAQIIDLN